MNKRREPLGPLAPEQERILCDPGLDPTALADLLLSLYRESVWLGCDCGWIMHIRGGHTLARNPGPTPDADPCALCQAWPYKPGPPQARGGELGPREPGLTLVATGRRRRSAGALSPKERDSGGAPSLKYSTMHRVIRTVMAGAGFVCLGGSISTALLWQRVREVLSLDRLLPDEPDGLTFADLLWTPESEETPEQILARVGAGWRHRDVEPQVWIQAVVEEIPQASEGRLELEIQGLHHVIHIDLPAQNRSRVGQSGPYFVMVQATRSQGGGLQHDRLAAQAILSTDCPVPVDSSHERDAVRLVQHLGLTYHKPMFAVVGHVTPDLMLLDLYVIVEVMGMNKEGYEEKKERMLGEIGTHPAFRSWRTIVYRPNRGESVSDLRRKLRHWWRESAALESSMNTVRVE